MRFIIVILSLLIAGRVSSQDSNNSELILVNYQKISKIIRIKNNSVIGLLLNDNSIVKGKVNFIDSLHLMVKHKLFLLTDIKGIQKLKNERIRHIISYTLIPVSFTTYRLGFTLQGSNSAEAEYMYGIGLTTITASIILYCLDSKTYFIKDWKYIIRNKPAQ